MRSKLVLSLLLAVAVTSCFGKKNRIEPGDGFAFFKTPESNEACVSSNLSQWELSGPFLHRMLRCASNRSEDGEETLPATQRLLASLPPDKLQSLIDFALIPDPTASTHEERYPYLLALATVLDRGLTDASRQGLNLTTERLGTLQPFLLSLDPARLQKQLTLWSRSGRLDELLAQLGALLDALEQDSLSAITHEILQGQSFGPRFLEVSTAVLGQVKLMEQLDSALSARPLKTPDASSRERMLQAWRQPQSPDTQERALTVSASPAPETSFAAHLAHFTDTLSDAEIKRLSSFLISFWNAYRNLDSEERLSLSRRVTASLEQGLDQQKNLVQWLLAVGQDLASMPAADLSPISETLGRLLEPSNDPTLDTLRSKLWSSRMMEDMLVLLRDGGPVPGCPSLRIQGLKDRPADDFGPTYELLRTLNTPQSSCADQVPLKLALETWSKLAVGRACPDADCLELQERSSSPVITASYWATPYQEPAASLLDELVRSTLEEARQQLERDRYYLKNIGVATRAVDPSLLDHMLGLWQKQKAQNLRELVSWESGLAQDPLLQPVLAPDPLEKMLSLQLERLSSLSQQFHELLPADSRDVDKSSNQRAARVFAGLYNEGPFEQALRYKLPATLEGPDDPLQDASWNWPADLKAIFASDRALFSHFLQRFKQADSIFRNPELGSLIDGDEVTVASLGSPQRYAGFSEPGTVALMPRPDHRVIQTFQSIRVWSEADSGAWGLWQQQLSGSSLVSKDIPPEQMASFHELSNRFGQAVSEPARWPELLTADEPAWHRQSGGINTAFFDIEPYSAADARLLTLYYLRHYSKLPLPFPLDAQLPALPAGGFRGFFSAAALVNNMDADFALFAKLYPQPLDAPIHSLEELASQALPGRSADQLLFPASKVTPVTRVRLLDGKYPQLLNNASFRLLSTYNLLGLTKTGSAYYIQPLVGLDGKSCAAADGQAAPCALQLPHADPLIYRDYLAAVITQSFCPVLASEQFGSSQIWSQRLQLSVTQASTCQKPKLQEAPLSDELRFPTWLSRRILNDVLNMGRAAHLKSGLAQIPAALRFYKLGQQNLDARERSGLWLRQARGHWSALNGASHSRRQSYAVQFWAGQPNLLNAFIDQWEQSIEPSSWPDFLARLARRDGDGSSRDSVHELLALVIQTQQESAQAGRSMLEMGLELLERVSAQPELLDTAGHLLGNYTSAENYDFAGRDLPLAFNLFTQFDWNEPGLRFTKFLTQKETLRTWVLLCESFSPDEFGRFIQQLQASSTELGPRPERADLLKRFLTEQVTLGTLLDPEQSQSLSESWNAILLTWQKTRFGSDFLSIWEALLASLDQPLTSLDGRVGRSAGQIFELWLAPMLQQGMSLLHQHQQSGTVDEVGFWSKIGLSIARSIQTEPLGARAFAHFLGDPRLGFGSRAIWLNALKDKGQRQVLAAALSSLSSVPEQLWREALVESSELLGRLGKALGYMKQRMVWKENPEHNAFRIVTEQLYFLSSDLDLRSHQIEILQLWFRDEPDDTRTAGPESAAKLSRP